VDVGGRKRGKKTERERERAPSVGDASASEPGWREIYHRDLNMGYILLDFPDDDEGMSLPNILLTDFGTDKNKPGVTLASMMKNVMPRTAKEAAKRKVGFQ
jgi:hypothetical protein